MIIEDGMPRMLKSDIGTWRVEEWCYNSGIDAFDWGRGLTYSCEWNARRDYIQRIRKYQERTKEAGARWVVVEEAKLE